ncbi:hypothetical protein [Xanthomonas sp. MUS 060]|uniref:hypothetical protein n=1 Tax=Xanthomonas sp. MUS 060 TaxID=1588031 RepID=UPI0013791404|nr:hypothetical protein [Xanthomonas sp. MUS 060]
MLEKLLAEEAQAPFALEQGPLIRGRLIRLAEDESVLFRKRKRHLRWSKAHSSVVG